MSFSRIVSFFLLSGLLRSGLSSAPSSGPPLLVRVPSGAEAPGPTTLWLWQGEEVRAVQVGEAVPAGEWNALLSGSDWISVVSKPLTVSNRSLEPVELTVQPIPVCWIELPTSRRSGSLLLLPHSGGPALEFPSQRPLVPVPTREEYEIVSFSGEGLKAVWGPIRCRSGEPTLSPPLRRPRLGHQHLLVELLAADLRPPLPLELRLLPLSPPGPSQALPTLPDRLAVRGRSSWALFLDRPRGSYQLQLRGAAVRSVSRRVTLREEGGGRETVALRPRDTLRWSYTIELRTPGRTGEFVLWRCGERALSQELLEGLYPDGCYQLEHRPIGEASGNLTFQNLDVGHYILDFHSQGQTLAGIELGWHVGWGWEEEAPAEELPLRIREILLTGHLTRNGLPVTAQVTLVGSNPHGGTWRVESSTDPRQEFRLSFLTGLRPERKPVPRTSRGHSYAPSGSWRLEYEIDRWGIGVAAARFDPGSGGRRDFEIEPSGVLELEVRDAATGQPVAPYFVAQRVPIPIPGEPKAGPPGSTSRRIEMRPLLVREPTASTRIVFPAGESSATLAARGYRPFEFRTRLQPGEERRALVELEREPEPSRWSLSVTPDQPASEARLLLFTKEASSDRWVFSCWVQLDAEGRLDPFFAGCDESGWDGALVLARGAPVQWKARDDFVAGRKTLLAAEKGPTVEVRLEDLAGEPVAGAWIELVSMDLPVPPESTRGWFLPFGLDPWRTDSQGSLTLPAVADPDRWRLRIWREGREPVELEYPDPAGAEPVRLLPME